MTLRKFDVSVSNFEIDFRVIFDFIFVGNPHNGILPPESIFPCVYSLLKLSSFEIDITQCLTISEVEFIMPNSFLDDLQSLIELAQLE